MQRRHVGLTLLISCLVGASSTAALAAPTAPSPTAPPVASHVFQTWTAAQARAVSPLLGQLPAGAGQVGASAAAEAFDLRVEDQMPLIRTELGRAFTSAAIDPTVGNRLLWR